jgi:Transcriptional activator of glycolytic enzymes
VFQHPDWQPFASAIQLADTSLSGQQQHATLLQQVLPQIPAAIYSSRDALLQQGARLEGLVRTVLDGRLARLEGNVNCLINNQLGAAQQLAEQLQLIGIGATQQAAIQGTLQPVALQPAAAIEPMLGAASPPAYTFINAQTVTDVWREYKEGIAGGPAVEQLEQQWQARWRPKRAQRTAWCRRKVIISEVVRLIEAGLTPADAVAELEARRGSTSLRSFQDSLAALNRECEGGQRATSRAKGKGRANRA